MNTFSKSTFISKLIGQISSVGVEKNDSASKSSKSENEAGKKPFTLWKNSIRLGSDLTDASAQTWC